MIDILKKTVSEFSKDSCAAMAAALAYYAVFSLPALLVVVISVAGLVYSPEQVQAQLESQIGSTIGANAQGQISTMISNASQPGRGLWGTVVGTAILLFGATGFGAQLQQALNLAWEVQPDPDRGGIRNFLMKRLLSFAMVLAIAFLLLISLVITTALNAFGDWINGVTPAGWNQTTFMVLNVVASFVIVALLFAAIFKVLPDAKIHWRQVAIGATFTAALFMVGKFALGLYLGGDKMQSTYGAAGSLVLVLAWIYYSSMILLLGAEFTQVWARRHGEQIEPDDHAVRIVRTVRTEKDTEKGSEKDDEAA
ncbi:MAG: YihY/virulence factor BrkB family protein [Planctomycetales bacterium]|nr:YihY/virulence factor BrkB family protein [Planctomycetales bacterium]